MALNATVAERRAVADRQLREKIRLEKSLTLSMQGIFNDIAQEMETVFAETGEPPDLASYNEQIQEVLHQHNIAVTEAFSNEITTFLASDDAKNTKTFEALAVLALTNNESVDNVIESIGIQSALATAALVTHLTNTSADLIAATNKRVMDDAIESAREEAISSEGDFTNEAIGAIAALLFLREGQTRADTISITTTQQAAEGVKNVEGRAVTDALASVVSAAEVALLIEPVWTSQRDNRVRPTHVEADGQRRGEAGVPGRFIVGGAFLEFPGDPSGPAEEIINCRCFLSFIVF